MNGQDLGVQLFEKRRRRTKINRRENPPEDYRVIRKIDPKWAEVIQDAPGSRYENGPSQRLPVAEKPTGKRKKRL